MSKIRRNRWVFPLSMIVAGIVGVMTPAQAKPPLDLAILRQQSRNEYINFEAVIGSLGITGGMTILDIGSGPGYASFLFAERLHGTGKVFATDIRRDFVDHITVEAKRRGLTNLSSHVVKEEGFDEFYGKHRYDLVFLSNVYHCLENRIEYFSKLSRLLNPDARLVLILYDQVPLFSKDDLSDVDGLIDLLAEETDEDPFHKHLSSRTRQLITEKADRGELGSAIVDDFNRMLVDPRFYKGFYDNSYFRKGMFTATEREFANWLLMTLKEDGIPEKPAGQIDARAMRAVIKLNRLFFIQRFGDFLAEDGMGAYVPAGDANRHTSKYVMLRELDAAGYEFRKEIKLSPYYDAVIMAPKAP